MKIRLPINTPDDVSRQNVPRMRLFGHVSSQKEGTPNYQRSSKQFSAKDHRKYRNPSDQYSSVKSAFGTVNSTSQYKVSEIVNPDGTITVRNLVVKDDGSWECQEEERDYSIREERPGSRSTSYHTMQSRSYSNVQSQVIAANSIRKKKEEAIPELTKATSFESSRTSTSSETMITAKSRSDTSDVSEGAAHHLRRQRLAKTRKLGESYPSSNYLPPTTSIEPHERSPSSPASQASSESSHVMVLMRSPTRNSLPSRLQPTTTMEPDSPPQPRRTIITRKQMEKERSHQSKHVAFMEPTTSITQSSKDYSGEKFSRQNPAYSSLFAHDDEESSIFRDVVTPSPDVSEKMDDILGPPSALPAMDTSASSVECSSTLNINSKSSHRGRRSNEWPATLDHSHRMEAFAIPCSENQQDDEQVKDSFIHSVTVHKNWRREKIGIFVGLKKFSEGTRLIVSKIAPDGKFANSGINVGDIVISVNGISMMEKPSSQEALQIVQAAKDRVTFVIQKRGETEDVQSVDGTSISSISRDGGFMSYVGRKERNYTTPSRAGQSSSGVETFTKLMTSEGNMLISRDSEISTPVAVKTNETWKLSGVIVVVVKKTSHFQKAGLRLGTKELLPGRVIYVADITPSGPFAKTPLQKGDVILSINDVDLEENADVVEAYAALGKPRDQISLVARKAEQSLNKFLRDRTTCAESYPKIKAENSLADEMIQLTTAPPVFGCINNEGFPSRREESGPLVHRQRVESSTSRNSFDFDEELYGAPFHGYNSSKNIKIEKLEHQEDVGLDLVPVQTEWGRLLTVASIVPRSSAAIAGVKVGDAVLAINGVDFRDNPDVERAILVMKSARRELNIEIQQLWVHEATVQSKDPEVPNEVAKFEQGSVGVVRTRTFDSNDDFLKQTEAWKIAKIPDSRTSQSDRVDEIRRMSATTVNGYQREGPRETTQGEEDQNMFSPQKLKQHRKVWVTVTKDYPSEQVGITFASYPDKLIVADVSPSGLLRATPLLPGDTILSINNIDFSVNPDVEYANHLVTSEPKEIIFGVLKTGYLIDVNRNDTKPCFGWTLRCGSRRKGETPRAQEKNDSDTFNISLIEQDNIEV